MFSRLLVISGTMRRRLTRPVCWAMTMVMVASITEVVASPAEAAPAGRDRPGVRDSGRVVSTRPPLAVEPRKPDPAAQSAVTKPPTVSWPAPGSAEFTVAASAAGSAAASVEATREVGGLPVSVSAPAGISASPSAVDDKVPGKVRVEVLDRKASQTARVDGPVLRIGRVDGRQTAGSVQVSVGYAGIANAFGGDFGARLRLARLPDCALTTPTEKGCAAEPLSTVNDGEARTVSTTVVAVPGAGGLYGLTAADASSQGDYGATKLAPSSKWSVAPSTGGFSWSYPLRTPPTPGGGGPSITLAYSSQAVDGRTATTNNQGSWIGEGFSYEPGHIERRYKPCSEDGHDQSADQCWAYDNATILLNGRSTELVKTGTTWRFATDDGSKVERFVDATNGDNDGEYWRVTTTNGTQYYFGLNRLPGWSSGKEETASTWTVPVYGDDSGEPCYKASFADSHCNQAWRWSLDYVKDIRGNVTSYFYEREDNYYARGNRTEVNGVKYHRGGWLKRIDYGQRDGSVYSTSAPARVRFDTAERCLPSGSVDCDPQDLKTETAAHWPDVPWDRNCAADTKCKPDQITPTFWTRKRLTTITTEIRAATGWSPVDRWSLDHLFTDNADGSRTLWLHKITHTGLVGGSEAMPSVELGGLQLPNRIDRDGDFIAPLIRFRLAVVYTDTGGQIDVNYAEPDCTQNSLPSAGSNTRRCYPVKWNPLGSGDPITDWFHKYVVDKVIETDRTGGAPDMVTKYDYLDGAAWRHEEPDGISDPDDLTWSEWRGYGRVQVTGGDGQTMTTRTEFRYLRGMHGDKAPGGGTRTVTVTDSAGGEYTDHDQFSGHELESKTFDGATQISKTINVPWRHLTATESHTWGDKKAYLVNTETTRALTALAAGGWRETKTSSSFETTFGRTVQTENFGDIDVTGDEACTRTSYADNPSAYLYALVTRVETVSVRCSATPDRRTQVLRDDRTWYDGKAFGEQPTMGNPTRTERLASHDGTTPTYVRVAEGTFDVYGRPLTATDANGSVTTTAYTETNGLTTRLAEISPLQHATTTDYAPAWGLPIRQVDPNGIMSELAYDALGRLVKVWLPDRSGISGMDPSIRYTYLVRADKPVAVKTEKRQNGGDYSVEYQLYDGLLRPRQVQAEGPDGTRMVADTFYTPTGKLDKTFATYHAAGAPSDQILPVNNGEVDGQTLYVYDGADRVTAEIFAVAGVEKWRTITSYGGDRVSVDPPEGETPRTTVTDALGQIVQLRQYKGAGPSGEFDATSYTYTPSGQLATVTDPAGNVWRHKYDQRGRKVETIDPDAGTSTYRYDDLDRLVTTTNGVGETVSYTYDAIGRKTATYQGATETGELLSRWVYDEEMLGQLSSTTRFVDGAEYTTYYAFYDVFYRPHETYYSIPEQAGPELAGMYVFGTEYNRDGTVQSVGMSDGGGLEFEAIAYTYDDLQQLVATTGDTAYLTDVDYAATGEVLQTEALVGGRKVWSTYEYERGTKRLTRQRLDRYGAPIVDIDARYTYDPAGNVTSIVDTPSGVQDAQCFTYDYLRRLTRAWTSAATTGDLCAGGPEATGVGGTAPYHHSYTYDVVGNRTSETQHATATTPLIERTYQYPAPGQPKPHTLTQVTESAPDGDVLYTYDYDDAGNTTRRTQAGADQDLTWDAEGNLESTTEAGKTTTFVYDVDGSRILRRDPDATTLYLPGMEIRLDHTTRALDPTRYYGLPGGATIVRKLDGLYYTAPDHHGTGQAVVKQDGTIIHRRSTPFGGPRGTQPAPGQWPTEKGFVNGNIDASTGLVNIGAREYDPTTGRFISIDPVIDVNDPQQMHGYAYANNNPVSFSDPDGLKLCSDDRCGPGADYVDLNGDYHNVPGHNDGCGGCSGAYDPDVPHINKHNNPSNPNRAADAAEHARQQRIEKAKQIILAAAKALAKIAMDELGITDALACLTKGDIGGCIATAIPLATAFVGGMVAKFAYRYGAPWRLKKAAQLAKRVWGLLDDLIDGVKKFLKCNSFMPGTFVLMADGTKKKIEDVDVGDVVIATDPETGETKEKTVVATIVGDGDKNLVEITVATDGPEGSATGIIVATEGHPFWAPELGQWIDATNLKPGQMLQTAAGTWVQVTAVQRWTATTTVHNLTVDDTHTYYVLAGATPVLVHNCGEASDNLLDYADEHIGKTNTASEIVSADGKVGYGVSGARPPSALTPKVRAAAEATGHHRGCSEIPALCDLERQGADLAGTRATTVKVMGGSQEYGPEVHGELYPKCLSCRSLFDFLDGK